MSRLLYTGDLVHCGRRAPHAPHCLSRSDGRDRFCPGVALTQCRWDGRRICWTFARVQYACAPGDPWALWSDADL